MEPTETWAGKTTSGTRRGLGRGLDALLPAIPATPLANQGELIRQIPISTIIPNPYQPRQQFNPERLQELAESIRTHGIVQPVVVRREADRYMLIAG